MTFFTDRHWFSGLALALVLLGGCAGGPEKPKPAELPSNPSLLGVKLAWSANIGAIDFSMQPKVADQVVTLANSQGSLISIDAQAALMVMDKVWLWSRKAASWWWSVLVS